MSTASALTKAELARVARRFERLSAGTGRLSFADFASTELGTPVFRRIWELLVAGDPDSELSEEALVAALSGVAHPATTWADRAAFLFRFCDANGDGRLDARELATALPRSVPEPLEAAMAALQAYAAEPAAGLTVTEFQALLAAGEGGGGGKGAAFGAS